MCLSVYVFVENVALLRNKARLANQITKHLLVGAIVSSRRRDNIFLNHDRAHVVRAKTQRHLSETQSLRQPRRLEVFDVVEKQTRHRKHLQIIDAGRLVFDPAAERGVLALERPRNKRREAAGLILQIANALQDV